jgi:hypothetical protein
MDPNAYFPYRIATLDRILRKDRFRLVYRPDHPSGRDEDLLRRRIVSNDVEGEVGPVPTGAGTDEVHERDLKIMRCAKRSVVGLIDGSGTIVVEESVRRLDVAVRRVR